MTLREHIIVAWYVAPQWLVCAGLCLVGVLVWAAE